MTKHHVQVSLKAAAVRGRDVRRNDGQAECPEKNMGLETGSKNCGSLAHYMRGNK